MKSINFKKVEYLELNEAYQKVMHWFFSYPFKEVSLSDLTKLINISKTTANRVITDFVKEEFLKVEKIGNIWRVSCNQAHHYNTTRKIAYNLELIYESAIIEAILKNIPSCRCIILFGSYRKGDDIETSDIDIAVETLDNEEVNIFELGIIPQLGYRTKVRVNVLKFSRNKIDLNLFANIVNGVVLYGFLEARP